MAERLVEGTVINVTPAVGMEVKEEGNFDHTWFIDQQTLEAARISVKIRDEVSFMANESPLGNPPIITGLRKIDSP